MRFLRHLFAVVLVVAVIVGLGLLLAHVFGGGPGGPGAGGQPDDGFQLADTSNLVRTCEIEAALAAVVVTAGAIRRRRRRMRRGAAAAVS